MPKKILVIPDVHGETFWKEPVQKYIDQVDRIIFLGDYLDPYPEEGKDYSPQEIFDNLMDIVDLKRNHMEKVVLLKGNHDQHYASEMFKFLACGSRCDTINWSLYNAVFVRNQDLFKLAHLEDVGGIPYLFSHAGLTLNWINKVNSDLWKLADNKISIADPDIVDRVNALDESEQGQELLCIVGRLRNLIGAKSGSILWADIEEHAIPDAPKAYGLNKVFQVVGHSRLNDKYDKFEFDNLVLIDSQQCFMIDEERKEKINTLKEYDKN
ncbi:MAG: metallophosphoesterase [Lachnospiraceae bacterium]|nr:metallophosphoesterase [Lachnospiraceae bacterium]